MTRKHEAPHPSGELQVGASVSSWTDHRIVPRTAVVTVAALMLVLTGCASAKQDRQGGAGKDPDQFGEATKVRVYTNADTVPNIAVFCVEDLAFWSGLNGDRAAASIGRLPEWDVSYCGAKAR